VQCDIPQPLLSRLRELKVAKGTPLIPKDSRGLILSVKEELRNVDRVSLYCSPFLCGLLKCVQSCKVLSESLLNTSIIRTIHFQLLDSVVRQFHLFQFMSQKK